MSVLNDSQRWQVLALVVFGGWLIWLLAPILTPFAIAAVFAYLADPVTDKLQARGLSRTGSVTIVFSLLSLVVTLVLVFLLPMLIEQVGKLAQQLPSMLEKLESLVKKVLDTEDNIFAKGDWKDNALIQQLTAHLDQIGELLLPVLGGLGRGGAAMLTVLVNLALIPVVTFYLLRDWDLLIDRIHELIPRQYEPTIVKLASESNDVLGSFLRGQVSVMFALGVIYSLGLSLIGLDLSLLIGMLAGLISFVPYLGTVVGLVAGVVAAWFQFGDITHLLLVLAVFGAGQMLEGMVLTPLLVGDRIGLHPVAVIFAVLAGGQLFGFLGILLGLPVAAIINVLLRHAHERYMQSGLYGAPTQAAADHAEADYAETPDAEAENRVAAVGASEPTDPTS